MKSTVLERYKEQASKYSLEGSFDVLKLLRRQASQTDPRGVQKWQEATD